VNWAGIVRLGLVQAAIGSIVVLATSTMNRVMVVELALPAVFPGLLVALHYVVQMARTRVGHGSDSGIRLTSWIVGGMAVLAAGGVGAAVSIWVMAVDRTAGMIAAVCAYIVIGLGAGACGTSLLVLLARAVSPERRAAAATITWLMMFVGFVVTAATVGFLLDPFSPARLVWVTAAVATVDLIVTVLAIWRVERGVEGLAAVAGVKAVAGGAFRTALAQVWNEPAARQFTIFVFVSMLAYSGQELLLEPFLGRAFDLSPGQSARIASLQHGGALVGMLSVAILGSIPVSWRIKSLRAWTAGGCLASACALGFLALSSSAPLVWPLRANVFVLGVANGVFAVSAIGSMMSLVSAAGPDRQGLRMGLWGAAQAVAFALGGAVSSATVDVAGQFLGTASAAYGFVFAAQSVLFLIATVLAASVGTVAMPLSQLRKGLA
jgi:MFS transporter, BCD family, chlorophyll transporter